MKLLKVSSSSNPGAAAGAIANGIRERGVAELQVIGPRAVNQAIKAIAIARGYLAASGVDLYCVPSFACIHIGDDEQEKTAIRFMLQTRHGVHGGASPLTEF
jgi:stage V sporulation protein S